LLIIRVPKDLRAEFPGYFICVAKSKSIPFLSNFHHALTPNSDSQRLPKPWQGLEVATLPPVAYQRW
jgi:hypothetical protein